MKLIDVTDKFNTESKCLDDIELRFASEHFTRDWNITRRFLTRRNLALSVLHDSLDKDCGSFTG
jgi:hypothetical protein